MRAGTREQIPSYPYVRFFPRSVSILHAALQSREFIESAFAQAKFSYEHHELIENEVASSWAEYAIKLSHRADSALVRLSDEEFEFGLESVRRYATGRAQADPVIELVDFFVFRLHQSSI